MKIDLDLSEIFSEGGEDVNESVRDMIINSVTEKIYLAINKEIGHKISTILDIEIKNRVKIELDVLIPSLMDYEFEETSRYGQVSPKITIKNRILKDIERECVWKDGNYDSDKSAFTKTLKAMVAKKMDEFRPAFDKELNAVFVKEAMDYAQKKLSERLGIK